MRKCLPIQQIILSALIILHCGGAVSSSSHQQPPTETDQYEMQRNEDSDSIVTTTMESIQALSSDEAEESPVLVAEANFDEEEKEEELIMQENEEEQQEDRNMKKKKKYKPHILFVIMDDLGTNDLGMHGTGIQTPVANQLADEGLFLDNYYVHPMCWPTRISLLTGKYFFESPKSGGMHLSRETLPEILKRGGYKPHAVGKWHVGSRDYKHWPTYRGFQSFYGCYGGHFDHFTHRKYGKDKVHGKYDGEYDMHYEKKEFCGPGCSKKTWRDKGTYSTYLFTRQSKRVIKNHKKKNKDKPLFLYLSYTAVHVPIQVPRKYENQYAKKRFWSATRKKYAGMLTAADESLGQVLQDLKYHKMWDDTLVIYTSDNGGFFRFTKPHLLRGKKGEIWEGGVLSDGIIGGPARAKLGIRKGTFEQLFHAVDWVPTLARIAGVSPRSKNLSGVNQMRALRKDKSARSELFLGYDKKDAVKVPCGKKKLDHQRYSAIRKGKYWKLVHDYLLKKTMLYNLEEDPLETTNVAGTNKKLTNSLFKSLKAHTNSQCLWKK